MVEHVAYEIWKDGKKDNDALTYQDLTVADCADGYEARPLVYLSDYAELEAENARLTKERDVWKERAAADAASASIWQDRAEALSRTGAVKVKALVNSLLDLRDLIMRGKRCVTDTGPAVKPVIELAAVHILDDAANALEALSALEPAAPDVIAKGLLSDADAKAAKLGKFGHHPDPAIDFEIEVESLQARLIDAKGGISKLGTEPEAPVAVLADIERAMTFRVGGDPSAVRAKQMLRDLEADAKQAVQPAAPEGKQPVAEAAIMSAILDCPHEIDAQSIILRRSSIAEGHNALNQLHRRLTVALKAAMEAGRHG